MKNLIYCLFLVFVINSHLREHFLGSYFVLDIIIGSLPNFVAAMIIPLSFVDYYVKYKKYNGVVIFMTAIFLIFEEFYPFLSGNEVFDEFDIIFTISGSFLSYSIIKRCKCKKNYKNETYK
ncbi:hypothetical protein [Flavicella sediminum]|uniref:hypothetical protein n=1 Tax=Flavicella sediminum TaxID=2585141 RepID=UPI00112161AA|nr:hypothetical protein [Flavicella sediminum]